MKKLTLGYEQYKNLVAKICRDITLDGWKPDYVVGIVRGGSLPATMISHYFNVPCESLRISLRDHSSCESNTWMASDAFGYEDAEPKNILIVDDINDSGATLNWLMRDWQDSCLPHEQERWDAVWCSNVRFAVVVDNLASKCSVGMNYFGMEVDKSEEDVWIDFPYEEWWAK
jgi:xanthine phosphoribosyltransferase